MDRKPRWLRRGPDLWTPTRALYPQGFRRDGAHPNELGARAMAVGWYRRLAGAAADPAIVAKYSEGLPPSEPAEPRPLRGAPHGGVAAPDRSHSPSQGAAGP